MHYSVMKKEAIDGLNIKENGIIENTIFLLLCLSSETNLLIAVGKPNCEIVINNEKVGNISIYKLIPSVPTILVIIILI